MRTIIEWTYAIKISKELSKYEDMVMKGEITQKEFENYIQKIREEAGREGFGEDNPGRCHEASAVPFRMRIHPIDKGESLLGFKQKNKGLASHF